MSAPLLCPDSPVRKGAVLNRDDIRVHQLCFQIKNRYAKQRSKSWKRDLCQASVESWLGQICQEEVSGFITSLLSGRFNSCSVRMQNIIQNVFYRSEPALWESDQTAGLVCCDAWCGETNLFLSWPQHNISKVEQHKSLEDSKYSVLWVTKAVEHLL